MSQSLFEEFKQWELGNKYEDFTLHGWYHWYEDLPENHVKHNDLYEDLASYYAVVLFAEYDEATDVYHFDVESKWAYPATLNEIFAGQCKKIYYHAFEPGCEIWETNDATQRFWPYRWLYIDSGDEYHFFKKNDWALVMNVFREDNLVANIVMSFENIRNYLKANKYCGELFQINYV